MGCGGFLVLLTMTLPTDVLVDLRGEVVRLLSHQLPKGTEMDRKAADLIKFNSILVGFVLSAFSLLTQWFARPADVLSKKPTWPFIAGLLLIFGSIIVATVAFRTTRLGAGLRADTMREVLADDTTRDEVLSGLIGTYTHMIEGNRLNLDKTVLYVDASMALLAAGLVLLGGGVAGLIYLTV